MHVLKQFFTGNKFCNGTTTVFQEMYSANVMKGSRWPESLAGKTNWKGFTTPENWRINSLETIWPNSDTVTMLLTKPGVVIYSLQLKVYWVINFTLLLLLDWGTKFDKTNPYNCVPKIGWRDLKLTSTSLINTTKVTYYCY